MPAKTRTSRGTGARRRKVRSKAIRLNPFLGLLETVRLDIDARLRGFLDARLDATLPLGPEVADLVSATRDLCLRGGKRLRPGLLVAGYRATDESAELEPALDAGVALELLQAYLLIHDDWMDQDPVRRGGPAVHALLARRYRSRHVGESSGILAGDLSIALATDALSRVDVPPARMPRLFSTFSQMQIDAIAGQQLDLLARDPDIEKTYALKTASYTVRGPLVLGALLAGARPRTTTTLERFAVPVGIAFQLRDDLLSVFGDPKETGKPFGNDLKSGKRTTLIARGLAMTRGKDRATLRAAWGNSRATRAELRRAAKVLETSGAKSEVEERIDELVGRALLAIDNQTLTPAGKELLEGAAKALTERRS